MTTHDALGAYAQRYGLEVIATVIPSRSTRGQASAGETAELVRTIRREQRARGVRRELGATPTSSDAIAREAGATVAPPLWADSLGPKGSSGATYIGSMEANTRTIAAALGGDLGALPLSTMLDTFSAPYMQRALVEIAAAGGARGRARRLDRAAAARVLHPLRRHRDVPRARGRRGVGDRAAARGARRRARLRGRARAAGARARRPTRTPPPGILLVAALALGALLASDVYRSGAGVDRLLFGTLIGLSDRDLVLTALAAALALAADAALRRAWLARAFDPDGVRALGVAVAGRSGCCSPRSAAAVIVALAAVGALLVSVVLVVPAATVRLVARDLRTLQLGTGALAAVEGVGALWLADTLNVAPGPAMAVRRRRRLRARGACSRGGAA